MTKSRRKKVNQANAAKSTGPKSVEGKKKVAMNAVVHGLAAREFEIVFPDAEEREKRLTTWNDAYEPSTPEEQKLVEQAAVAEFKLRAAVDAHDALINEQVRMHHEDWESNRLDRRDELIELLLGEKPAYALRELRKFQAGAEWVRDAWREMQVAFKAHGMWDCEAAIGRALRLSGYHPDRLMNDPSTEGYALAVIAYSCYDDRERAAVYKLTEYLNDQMPITWAATNRVTQIDRERAKGQVAGLIAKEVAWWEERATDAEASEVEAKACAEARAYVPHDTPGNKLLLRYTSTASSSLNKAMEGLKRAQKDREKAAEKAEKRGKANEANRPPLDAEPGKSYVNVDGLIYRADPIGDGLFQMTPVTRRGPGGPCHVGTVCDPVEKGPEEGV